MLERCMIQAISKSRTQKRRRKEEGTKIGLEEPPSLALAHANSVFYNSKTQRLAFPNGFSRGLTISLLCKVLVNSLKMALANDNRRPKHEYMLES